VVHPCDAPSLRGALQAAAHGLIEPVLVGPRHKLGAAAAEAGLSLQGVETVDVRHSHDAADTAAEMALSGQVEVLMKGSLHTDELLHAVLARPGYLREIVMEGSKKARAQAIETMTRVREAVKLVY
jgi:phosphate acetyltransferase